jgi:LytS/YehU family sensor histidine kinase
MHSRVERLSAFRWPSPFWILACALVLGTISASEHYMQMADKGGEQLGWSHALEFRLPFWLLWGGLAPLVARIARKVPRDPRFLQIGLLLLAGFALSIPEAMVEYLLFRIFAPQFYPGTYFGTLTTVLPYCMPNNLLIFAALVGITYAADLHTRYRERELAASRLGAQLAQAELHALRMQLNPHFLFNAMNSISMLVRHGKQTEAVRTVAGLSDLLRTLLDEERPHEVSLREEITLLTRYLEIEKIRFSDRLAVTISVPDQLLDARVPSLILQPLVENAIRHGIARRTASGRLTVTAEQSGDRLVLQVIDDGPGLQPAGPNGTGVGLRNTRARLQQLYGQQQRLDLRNGDSAGTVATIELPYHLEAVEEFA